MAVTMKKFGSNSMTRAVVTPLGLLSVPDAIETKPSHAVACEGARGDAQRGSCAREPDRDGAARVRPLHLKRLTYFPTLD